MLRARAPVRVSNKPTDALYGGPRADAHRKGRGREIGCINRYPEPSLPVFVLESMGLWERLSNTFP